MLVGPCMMRLVRSMKIWSITWKLVTISYSKNLIKDLVLGGKLILLDIQTIMHDFSQNLASMLSSSLVLISLKKKKEQTKLISNMFIFLPQIILEKILEFLSMFFGIIMNHHQASIGTWSKMILALLAIKKIFITMLHNVPKIWSTT